MRLLVFSERLAPPPDEGIKKLALSLAAGGLSVAGGLTGQQGIAIGVFGDLLQAVGHFGVGVELQKQSETADQSRVAFERQALEQHRLHPVEREEHAVL